MQKRKKLKTRILSLAMSVIMSVTMTPTPVFAVEGGTPPEAGDAGVIHSFEKLEEPFAASTGKDAPSYVYGLTVEVNTPLEELGLPTELTAIVARTTVLTEPEETLPEETTPEEEETTATSSDADKVEEETTERFEENEIPLAPAPEQDEEEKTVSTIRSETIPVEWKSNIEFVSDKKGGPFIFTAELTEDYTLASGVKQPQIYVFVGDKQARNASFKITQALDFTGKDYVNTWDCTKEPLKHTHSGSEKKCFDWNYFNDRTLTLGDLNLETSDAVAIQLPKQHDINLVLDGTANVKSTFDGNSNTYGISGTIVNISGSGVLNVTGGNTTGANSMGIFAEAITVKEGTLTAAGGTSTGANSVGIQVSKKFAVADGTVEATGGTARNSSFGIIGKDVIISGGTVKATGGIAEVGFSYGISVDANNSLAFSGKGTVVKASGDTKALSKEPEAPDFDVTPVGKTWESAGSEVIWTAIPITDVVFTNIEANGVTGTADTTELTLTFDQDIPGLAVSDITVVGAAKGDLTKEDGTGVYKLTLPGVTVANEEEVTVEVIKRGYLFDPASKNVKVFKNTSSMITKALDFSGDQAVIAGCTDSYIGHSHNAGEECFTWDNDSKILTLGDLYLVTNEADLAIVLPGSSTIVLNGAATVKNTKDSSSGTSSSSGIHGQGDLTIRGSGALGATGGKSSANSSGISANRFTIEDGEITAQGKAASGFSYGIYSVNSITINGGKVTAIADTGFYSYGIASDYQSAPITFNNAGTVVKAASGSGSVAGALNKAPVANGFTITPGGATWADKNKMVTWTSAFKEAAFSGLTANGTSDTITTTELTLTFDQDIPNLTAGDITVTGATKGTLTKESGTGVYKLAISDITVANGENVTVGIAKTGYNFTPDSRTAAVFKKISYKITKSLNFTDAQANVADCWDPYIGHTHTGGKCFTWDKVSKCLTLNNLELETPEDISISIQLPANAEIVLAVGSTNTVTSTYDGISECRTIYGVGALTISGTGSLDVTGGTSSAGSSIGIMADGGNISITGGTVTSSGSIGIMAGGTITFSGIGTVVKAKGSDKALNKEPVVEDFTVTPSGSTWETANTQVIWTSNASLLMEAKPLAEAAISGITATNSTTAANILSSVNASISSVPGVSAAWKAGSPVIIKATTSAEGSVTGTIVLTYGSDTMEVMVDKTIAKLSSGGFSSGESSTTILTSLPPFYQGGTKVIGNIRVPDYTIEGNWKKDANGNWTFTGLDGKSYANGWAPVFNPYADVARGQNGFDWFMFDANGRMMTGWYTDAEGNTFYLNPTSDNLLGAMRTGWVLIDGKYYYFNEKPDGTRGKLLKNTTTPDGYLVDKNGVWNGEAKK